ncbi:hypothetical protein [Anaeroselena agilis]|uniref:Uncharacterized protein n=1 Tax=Anaeroselena agilis TaxID=3063788 RepID=A0ABU3NYK5_9FIRM|nr:hypothetical protein [Selenomonadales bacterium 4137-cl]
MERQFLRIVAEHDQDGNIRPLLIKWKDGRCFTVDRVLDVRQAPALAAGGLGIRYHCRIHGKEYYLFCDEGKWFVERPESSRPLREGKGR